MTTTYDPHHAAYLDQADVRHELARAFDICSGCRQCVDLCAAFPNLFELIDRQHDSSDTGRMTPFEQDQITDSCHQCTLCSLGCPYTSERDERNLDMPRLMLRAKALQHANGIASTRGAATTKMVNHTDGLGKFATAPIANRLVNRVVTAPLGSRLRRVAAKVTGISAARLLAPFATPRFSTWFEQRGSMPGSIAGSASQGRVTIFPTCLVEYQATAVGMDLVQVYERNRIECEITSAGCCGAPWLHSGDIERFIRVATANVAALAAEIRAGTDIVVPQPTCSYVVKHHYADYVDGSDAGLVAAHTFDAAEYLMAVHAAEGTALDLDFPGETLETISYHAACHLRSQRIGLPGRDLMELTGAEVTVVEQCSGSEGVWDLRAGNDDLSIPMAQRLGDLMERAGGDALAGDCQIANTALVEQTGRSALHPLQIIARAYGISDAQR